MRILIQRLQHAFDLTLDLVQAMKSDDLKLKLEGMPSNMIGEQLWCIIGARESYLKAIINGGWVGFTCSLDDVRSKKKIVLSLQKSAADIMDFLNNNELNEGQLEILITLLEHEIQHHGQLIRYVYGNRLTFPKSW